MRWQVLLCVVVVLLIYLVVGGLIFWSLESVHEVTSDETQQETDLEQHIIREFNRRDAENHRNVCWTAVDLLSVVKNWTAARKANETEQHQQQWSLPGSLFFSITVITTIGYGNLTPRSVGGRIFCCFYAIIGIPLCLVTLVSIGERLNAAGRWLEQRCPSNGKDRWRRYVRSLALTVLGMIVFLLVPAAVFVWLEDWNYGTALYFSVVTLSTIGFGDYVAGINYTGLLRPVYRLLVGVWIFCGLAWLAGIFCCIQEWFQAVATRAETKLTLIRRSKDQVDKQHNGLEGGDDKGHEVPIIDAETPSSPTGLGNENAAQLHELPVVSKGTDV